MTYGLCKKIIAKGNYDKDELLNKMDIFLLNNRITQEQYNELASMINSQED